ncbi:MAG: tRNA threonylcarbamoyladenosine dehydratase [Christensenellaceae bacterium]|nr:tRNA threonylcarbamoyladenosine dehydratase [Christensenellaceae bacterium]
MEKWQTRTAMLLGQQAMDKLADAHVAVFGVGGVGSFAAEALARAGVGQLSLFDKDAVDETNLNRQLIALKSTVGLPKADVMAARIRDIHPACRVHAHKVFYLRENADRFDLTAFDYVVDAVDTVAAKLELSERCTKNGVPIISAMGAGNKLDPTAFRVSDLSKTSGCPLARVMRRELKKRGIFHVKVVYSTESPRPHVWDPPMAEGERVSPASISFVPSVAGLILAGQVVKDLCGAE